MKTSQIKFVVSKLDETGEISRNECLRNFISRLGAIIHILKKEGWQFNTESRPTQKPDGTKGRDFVYKLAVRPTEVKQLF